MNHTEKIFNVLNSNFPQKGSYILEQKFKAAVEKLSLELGVKLYNSELYGEYFPTLNYGILNRNLVYENILKEQDSDFKPLFHDSEIIYRKWINNSFNSNLFCRKDTELSFEINVIDQMLADFYNWVTEEKAVKGGDLLTSLRRETENLIKIKEKSFIKFSPRNSSTNEILKTQLETESLLSFKNGQFDYVFKKEGDNVLVKRKRAYDVNASELQDWFLNFGISISLTTGTYLLEFGLPYQGILVPITSMFHVTDTGYGVIGLLVYELKRMKFLFHEYATISIAIKDHPLKQSIVIALARLEHYLNPKELTLDF